jgi:hypothetical protein
MTVVAFRKPAIAIGCTSCGATVDAACDCGTPYMPAGQRAAAAVAANPNLSDRAIAKEIGVGKNTVLRARQELTGPDGPVDGTPRIGLDGRARRIPIRAVEDADIGAPTERRRDAFLIFANEAMLLANYDGPICDRVIEAARQTERAWGLLVAKLEKING